MNRHIAAALAPLLDILVFDALIAVGVSMPSSHVASFTLGIALNYLLKVRSMVGFQQRTESHALQLLSVTLMALFLRGALFGWLIQTCGWPSQLAILCAVAVGMAVIGVGYPLVLPPPGSKISAGRLALTLISYAIALKLVFAASVELLPEEAYYWNYSRHLDIGYLDHPPMVAWLIWLGTHIAGQSEFGVRLGALLCGAVTSFFAYRLTRNLFGEASALAALVLVQTLPFFFLSGLLMTPDAPLTAAWAASLYFLERALIANRAEAWWRAGLGLGVGFISKYSIGLLGPVTCAFLLWDPRSRRWWSRWEPYAAALIALVVLSPVLIWNAQHEWASFAFQTSRRLAEAPHFNLHKLIASTLILITPIGVFAVALGLLRGKSAEPSRRWLFVNLSILIPLAVFALFSLRHEVKLDWTGAPWTAALPVMAFGMINAGVAVSPVRAWVRSAWTPTIVIVLLLYGFGTHYLLLGIPGLGYDKHIELLPVGWRDLGRQVVDITSDARRLTGTVPMIVGTDRYAIASELAFYGAEEAHAKIETSSAHLFEGVGLMYERWTPAAAEEHRDLLLVALDPRELSGKYVESHVERLGPITEGVLTRNGQMIRHYYYRAASGYSRAPR